MSSVTQHLRFGYLCYKITDNGNNSEYLTNNKWVSRSLEQKVSRNDVLVKEGTIYYRNKQTSKTTLS